MELHLEFRVDFHGRYKMIGNELWSAQVSPLFILKDYVTDYANILIHKFTYGSPTPIHNFLQDNFLSWISPQAHLLWKTSTLKYLFLIE